MNATARIPKNVALFTRAWIEIHIAVNRRSVACVALFTRAWIEISPNIPARNIKIVALFTRAWIEIVYVSVLVKNVSGRPLHEGVD